MSGNGTSTRTQFGLGILRRVGLFTLIWSALVGTDPEGWAFGAAAIPAAILLSVQLLPIGRSLNLTRLVATVPGFLARSFAGGLDVARRAFDPRLPLQPGWLIRDVGLSAGGRVALGAELSLMPGTLVAGSHGHALLIHVLDTGADHDRALATEEARLVAITGHEDA